MKQILTILTMANLNLLLERSNIGNAFPNM